MASASSGLRSMLCRAKWSQNNSCVVWSVKDNIFMINHDRSTACNTLDHSSMVVGKPFGRLLKDPNVIKPFLRTGALATLDASR